MTDHDPDNEKIQRMLKRLQKEVDAGTMTHAAANKALGNYADGLRHPSHQDKRRRKG